MAKKNRNYVRGRSYEYRTMKILRGKGYRVQRASSSKGDADVIGYGPGEIRLVQVKSERKRSTHRADFDQLLGLANMLGEHPRLRIELWVYRNGQLEAQTVSPQDP